MLCPVCKVEMIVVEHNKIELDYCTNCHGVWFDAQELELWLESMKLESSNEFLGNVLGSAEAQSPEQKRKCPICHDRMKKVHIGQQPKILIDVCQQGDGLWFDGGEISQLIGQLAKPTPGKVDSQQQVTTFMEDVFRVPE